MPHGLDQLPASSNHHALKPDLNRGLGIGAGTTPASNSRLLDEWQLSSLHMKSLGQRSPPRRNGTPLPASVRGNLFHRECGSTHHNNATSLNARLRKKTKNRQRSISAFESS